MSHKFMVAVLAGIALTEAHATEAEPATYTFSGYGTLGVVHSSEKQADYTAPRFRPNGAGHTRSWSADSDSRLAGQLSANFNDQWSAVVQIVAEQRWDNSYTPKLEWANVQYAPTPKLSIRIGRIAVPTLLMTNSAKIGYTMPWTHAPDAMYRTMPFTSADGIDATYIFNTG